MSASQLYIKGQWVDPLGQETVEVINPTTEAVIGQISHGNQADVDTAVSAAKEAFPAWNALALQDRVAYVQRIADGIRQRQEDLLACIIEEMGSARSFASYMQVERSADEIEASIQSLDRIDWQEEIANASIQREGVGVVAAINPWNYPMNQIQRKISPALLAGNTVVVKPASETPYTALLLTEIIHEAGLPAGVYNLVSGSGSEVGDHLAGHPDVDLISFTGSTEVGRKLYTKAATTVKRMVLELGGKSALIILEGGDLDLAAQTAVNAIVNNAGQSCAALTRILVPRSAQPAFEGKLLDHINQVVIGDPNNETTDLGPLVSAKQMETVLDYIDQGLSEGARLLYGGQRLDRPGYFVEPTIFVDVRNDMTIAQEEIFGPVMSVIYYDTVEEAIALANDSNYGLSGAVIGPEDLALHVAKQLRTGEVAINGASPHVSAPFGGYRQSGNGRERGSYGVEEYLEIKAIHR